MKPVFYLLPLFLSATMVAQAQTNLVLNASVDGMPNDSTIYLYGFRGEDADSTIVKDHSFHFNRKLKDGGDVYVIKFGKQPDPNSAILTYLGPGEVTLKGTFSEFNKSTIKGPLFLEEFKDADHMIQDSLLFSHGDASLDDEIAEAQRVGDQDRYKELMETANSQKKMLKELAKKWVMKHLNSGVSAYVINICISPASSADETLAWINKLTPAAQQNAYVRVMRKQMNDIQNHVASGNPLFMPGDSLRAGKTLAPVFTSTDTQGKQVSLTDFKGKYVLVDFWASWCGPCRAANPELKNLYAKFKDRNFTILGVSLDTKKEAWLEAIQQDQLPWAQVSDLDGGFSSKVAELYHVGFIPTNYLIDPQGRIIGSFIKDEQTLQRLLDQHSNPAP